MNNPVYAARPSFTFHNLWDFANDAPYKETGQFASATGIPFADRQDGRENLWGLFVQDDFKLRPNLTVNLGLRWSYFGAFYAKQNNLDVMRFGSGADPLAGLNIRVGGNLYDPQKSNFGPVVNKTNINPSSIDASLGSVAPDGTISSNADFGVAGSALGSRTIQLQARFSF